MGGPAVKKRVSGILMCLMLLFSVSAGQTVIPPVSVIGEEAFLGCGLERVTVPDGAVSLGAGAFADNPDLTCVRLPSSLTGIGDGAFDGCSPDLMIYADSGSYAAAWAVENGLDLGGGTVRTVIAAQSYAGSSMELTGTVTDAQGYKDMLSCFSRTCGSVSLYEDLTGSGMLSVIGSAFSSAGDRDISIFVYAGHGIRTNGYSCLVGSDEVLVTAAQLYSAFSAVAGRKVLIVDACHSGGLITDETVEDSEAAGAFVDGLVAAFAAMDSEISEDSELTVGGFYVIAACAADQSSYEVERTVGGVTKSAGLFSYYFNEGCGWNEVYSGACSLYADADGSGVVSLGEVCTYVRSCTARFSQTMKTWPSDLDCFGLFRND